MKMKWKIMDNEWIMIRKLIMNEMIQILIMDPLIINKQILKNDKVIYKNIKGK